MMLASPVARVYAEALFELARSRDAVADVAEELDGFHALVSAEEDIDRFLRSPVIDPAAKVERLQTALRGQTSDLVTDFLCLLVQKRRFAAFGIILEAFRALADEHAGLVRVAVRSAVALSDPMRAELVKALAERLDRKVEMQAETDPRLMGGAVVRVGDRVWDGSLRARLNGFRKQLVRS
ncbi:ATP synthase F1 subunit delta [bacterium]|nr:ATP synthase F1 subunit delta [bacterium]